MSRPRSKAARKRTGLQASSPRGGAGPETSLPRGRAGPNSPSLRDRAGSPGSGLARPGASPALAFAAILALCLVVGGGYVGFAAWRAGGAARVSGPPVDTAALNSVSAAPHVLFISMAVGDTYGKVALAPLDAPDAARVGSALQCDRVYFAAGNGLCLGNNVVGGFLSTYSAYTFGLDYAPKQTFDSIGIPSRVRVADTGELGATTVFVNGHSYADSGFSTLTQLIDMASGATLADLESFEVWRDGVRFLPVDRNFWGVTFTRDGGRFYATLGRGGQTYLIEGDVRERSARVLREGVECPSLSPDGTRLAYKRQQGAVGRPYWALHVLDLASGADTALTAETRNVDDQVEWLDDGHLLYALAPDGPPRGPNASVWRLPLDGGAPQPWLTQAYSPAVVRPAAAPAR